MTRLTKEEIEKLRVWADGAPRPGLAALVVRALDELEGHRAREGKGVWLDEDAVEKIRKAIVFDHIGGSAPLIVEALALLPPKREPTLLEAAKAVMARIEPGAVLIDVDTPLSKAVDDLRAAIEREIKR